MGILGVVFTDKVIVQPLSDFIPVSNLPLNEVHYARIARFFVSVANGIKTLKDYWNGLDVMSNPPTPPQDHPRFYPYVCQCTPPNTNTTVAFRYLCPFEADHSCVTFLAETRESYHKIVVKFVERYNPMLTNVWQ